MSKRLSVALFTLMLLVLFVNPGQAQLEQGAYLWTLNLGYLPLKNAETVNSLDGYGLNTTFEKLIQNSGFALGFNLGVYWTQDEIFITPDMTGVQSFRSNSIYGTLKYMFFTSSNWSPYVGLGVGVQTTVKDVAVKGLYVVQDNVVVGSQAKTGFVVAAPLGVNYFIDAKTFVGLNVLPLWAEDSFYEQELNWMFNLSLGFQF